MQRLLGEELEQPCGTASNTTVRDWTQGGGSEWLNSQTNRAVCGQLSWPTSGVVQKQNREHPTVLSLASAPRNDQTLNVLHGKHIHGTTRMTWQRVELRPKSVLEGRGAAIRRDRHQRSRRTFR